MPFSSKTKIFFLLFLVLLLILAGQERSPRWGLSLYGSVNMFLRSGSASGYEIGINEFPITASHTSYGMGFALQAKPFNRFFWGLTLEYLFDTQTTIKDPVDDDKAQVESHRFFSGFLSVGYRIARTKSLALSLQAGLGGYYLTDNEGAQYTTSKGYILEIEPADQELGLAGFAGIGVEVWISRSLAILFHSRYLYLAAIGQGAAQMQLGVTLAL